MEMYSRESGSHSNFDSIGDIEAVKYETVCEIEKELEPCHVYSLVFLLYDVAHTALQRLTIYQRVSKDNSKTNLLSEWVLDVQNKCPVWRYKFIEALTICQLYRILRKIGLNIKKIRQSFQNNELYKTVHINHIKKGLYVISENVTYKILVEIKSAIGTYGIDVSEYQTCELVFLKLMCENFITGNFIDKGKMFDVEKLAKVFDQIPELCIFARNLRKIGNEIVVNNKTNKDDYQTKEKSFSNISHTSASQDDNMLVDIFSMLNKLAESDLPEADSIASRQKYSSAEIYPLKNKHRPGVCYIINQEDFIDEKLENRTGSTKDSLELKNTMEYLKFEVITHSNLKRKEMLRSIRDIMRYRVHHDDSVFVLCILSHGIKDHVFSADSVPIKIDDIQDMFDAEDATHLFDIPKIFIIEACQIIVDKTEFVSKFEADSPKRYHIRKSDCLIFYATASQLEAYRHPEHGTIFIQTLCRMLKKFADQDDVLSIFTRVNNMVRCLCEKIQKEQIPTISTTLVKKLYLK